MPAPRAVVTVSSLSEDQPDKAYLVLISCIFISLVVGYEQGVLVQALVTIYLYVFGMGLESDPREKMLVRLQQGSGLPTLSDCYRW